jgi:hypothetical protein
MKSGISRLIATAGATVLLVGAGALAATSASADTAAAHAVTHSAPVPMSGPIAAHSRDLPVPPPDYCLWLLGLPLLCD